MKNYKSLAWKELMAQKITSILILIAVILSTIMTTAIGQSLGILDALRQQQAASINGNRYATFHQLTAEQADILAGDSRLSFTGNLTALGISKIENSGLTLQLREYQGQALSAYPSQAQLDKGRLPAKAGEIALPQDVLQLLGFTGSIGDTVTLPLQISLLKDDQMPYKYSADFTLTGILKSNYVGYVSGSVSGIAGPGSAAMMLPARYQLYSTDIRMKDKTSFQQTLDDLKATLGVPDYCVQYNDIYLTALGIKYSSQGDNAETASGFPFMAIAGVLIGFLVLLASGLVIYNILKIAVTKRIRSYGTLRAMGGESIQLYSLVALQLAILCGIGIPLGAVIGVLSAKGITIAATGVLSPGIFMADSAAQLATLISQNSTGKLIPLITSGAITLLFAFIAAMPAARHAAKVSPTVAMSGTSVTVKRRKRKIGRIRHFEAFYARLNLKRNIGRTTITILSLVMSITVFVALQNFSGLLDASGSVQKMHLGDYSITNESAGFSSSALEELREQPGIESVSTLKYSIYFQDKNGQLEMDTSISLNPSETLQIIGLDEERLRQIMPSATDADMQAFKAGKACFIKNPVAMSFEGQTIPATSIAAGDIISVASREINVLGQCESSVTLDNSGFVNGVQVILFDTAYDSFTGKNTYSELYPALTPDADRSAIEAVINRICSESGGHFLSYQNTDEQLEESYQQIKMLCWSLILFIGLIGVLNIINTVYTNIHTRVTEIGVQRAIGMSASSLYKIFLWEGAYYGVIAAIIGSIMGYICTIFVSAASTDMIEPAAIPVIPILQATVISMAACLIATCIPLRKIAKMSIVESIETVE